MVFHGSRLVFHVCDNDSGDDDDDDDDGGGGLHVRPAGRWPLQDFIKTDCVSPGKRKSPFDELVEF